MKRFLALAMAGLLLWAQTGCATVYRTIKGQDPPKAVTKVAPKPFKNYLTQEDKALLQVDLNTIGKLGFRPLGSSALTETMAYVKDNFPQGYQAKTIKSRTSYLLKGLRLTSADGFHQYEIKLVAKSVEPKEDITAPVVFLRQGTPWEIKKKNLKNRLVLVRSGYYDPDKLMVNCQKAGALGVIQFGPSSAIPQVKLKKPAGLPLFVMSRKDVRAIEKTMGDQLTLSINRLPVRQITEASSLIYGPHRKDRKKVLIYAMLEQAEAGQGDRNLALMLQLARLLPEATERQRSYEFAFFADETGLTKYLEELSPFEKEKIGLALELKEGKTLGLNADALARTRGHDLAEIFRKRYLDIRISDLGQDHPLVQSGIPVISLAGNLDESEGFDEALNVLMNFLVPETGLK